MTPIDTLLSRASVGELLDPAPDGAELDAILGTGLRAPDHGKLRPWQFVLIRGEARRAWADTIVSAMLARDPETPEFMIEKQRKRALTTPLIIALGVRLQHGHKIPEIEQMMAVGAATMNLLNAIHALGYGGLWVTGGNSYDPAVVEALGLERTDKLAGFLFVGTPSAPVRQPRRPDLANHVTEWAGARVPA